MEHGLGKRSPQQCYRLKKKEAQEDRARLDGTTRLAIRPSSLAVRGGGMGMGGASIYSPYRI